VSMLTGMASATPAPRTCPECGFSWAMPSEDAIGVVAAAPQRFRAALSGHDKQLIRTPAVLPWAAVSYVWHLADVLRISAERLWALSHDPQAPIIPYDPDQLADARHYAQQSAAAGLWALERSTGDWLAAAAAVHDHDPYHHPEFGQLTGADAFRLIGHEVDHHAWDVQRCLNAPADAKSVRPPP
jgi:DinB superfamily